MAGTAMVCARCRRPLDRGGFVITSERHCLRCALRHRPLLHRSLATALVVGTALVLINQGPELLAGTASPALVWKVPLTYAVPFCVATWGALSNSRTR